MNSGEHTSRSGKEHWLEAFRQLPVKRAVVAVAVLIGILLLLPVTPGYVDHMDDAGYALLFDGNNDYVELHETSQVMGSGWEAEKTVSLWVKPTGTVTCYLDDPAKCDLIFSEKPRWWGISHGERNGEDKIWIWNFDGDFDVVGVNYSLDSWVHVTLVHDDGVLRAYRNGVEVGNTPSGPTQRPDESEPVLHLGGVIVNTAENWTFAGHLDEVRLWNYARTTTQVQADMYHSLNGDELGLRAYYMMSDGSGLTLTDDTGNGWDGTLYDGGYGVSPDGSPPEWVASDAFEAQPTATPTPTSTNTPTATPTVTNTPTPGPSSTPTSTPDPNSTPTSTPDPNSTPTSTPDPNSTPTSTPISDDFDFHYYLPVVDNSG